MGETLTWADWQAAYDRDKRLFVNDPRRCQDCRMVEACRCGAQWRDLPEGNLRRA